MKDRLIGDEGGEEFLEEEKEGVSFFSPEIPRGGNKEGENFVGMVEGKREISFSPPGGESSDRGGDFSKEEFSPTTEKGGSEGEGSSLGKELPELSGGEGSPHSEAALRRVRVAEAEALRRAKGRTPQAPLIPYFLTAGGDKQQGVFCRGFFLGEVRGGVELGGEGGVFVAGSFAGFGQRVRIGVWPGR